MQIRGQCTAVMKADLTIRQVHCGDKGIKFYEVNCIFSSAHAAKHDEMRLGDAWTRLTMKVHARPVRR